MENRLELNKRPVYELPDEVVVGEYRMRPDIKRCKTPDFEPDICLNSKYNVKVSNKGNASDQIWIKSDNNRLIEYIKKCDFNKHLNSVSIKHLYLWKFKKIILEEFYGVKYGE